MKKIQEVIRGLTFLTGTLFICMNVSDLSNKFVKGSYGYVFLLVYGIIFWSIYDIKIE